MTRVLSAAGSRAFHQWCARELIRDAQNRMRAFFCTTAQLDAMLGLSAIKAALSAQPHTMPPPLAQIAYEAYCESRNWHSVTDQLLPPWHDQTPELKTAWDAAAQAVRANLSQHESLSTSGAITPPRTHSGTP